jgi:hypothetical protein
MEITTTHHEIIKNVGFIEIDKPDDGMMFETCIFQHEYEEEQKQMLRYGQAKIHTAYTMLKQRERFEMMRYIAHQFSLINSPIYQRSYSSYVPSYSFVSKSLSLSINSLNISSPVSS